MIIKFGFKLNKYNNRFLIVSNSKTIESSWYVQGGHFNNSFNFKFPLRLYKIVELEKNNFQFQTS